MDKRKSACDAPVFRTSREDRQQVYAETMLALDHRAAFDPARTEQFLSEIPARPAVVLIEPRPELGSARPLLLRTADLRRRLRLLLGPPHSGSKRVNLREYAAAVRFRPTGSAFEQALVQWQHARVLWPGVYRERLRLRPPAMIKLNLAHAYPRAHVTRRVGSAAGARTGTTVANGLYFGPFASRRSAESVLEPVLDLFQIRRCQIKIRRDPTYPGCIYSEMKMCLAPCFAGCTAEEYSAEARRVAAFLLSRGASLAEELGRERETASEQLEFEQAAALHRRLEKADAVRRGLGELVRPVEKLNAVVLQRAAEENSIAVFAIRAGVIAEPFLLRFTELASQPRPVEQILREILEPASPLEEGAGAGAAPVTKPAGDRLTSAEMEDHLALLAKWFYGKPHDGEIFFEAPAPIGWPYRRILRACSRLLAPREPAAGG